MRKAKAVICISAVLPLLIGTVLYVLCRPDTIVSGIVRNLTGFGSDMSGNVKRGLLFDFVRFYLPDILWAYAFPNALMIACVFDRKCITLCTVIPMAFSVLTETFQLLGLISGTGDPADCVLECVAVLAAVFHLKVILKEVD